MCWSTNIIQAVKEIIKTLKIRESYNNTSTYKVTQLSNNHQLTWQNSVKREFSNFGFEQIFVIHTMPKSMIKEKRSY